VDAIQDLKGQQFVDARCTAELQRLLAGIRHYTHIVVQTQVNVVYAHVSFGDLQTGLGRY
jgi:hypothetical protein